VSAVVSSSIRLPFAPFLHLFGSCEARGRDCPSDLVNWGLGRLSEPGLCQGPSGTGTREEEAEEKEERAGATSVSETESFGETGPMIDISHRPKNELRWTRLMWDSFRLAAPHYQHFRLVDIARDIRLHETEFPRHRASRRCHHAWYREEQSRGSDGWLLEAYNCARAPCHEAAVHQRIFFRKPLHDCADPAPALARTPPRRT